MKYYLSHILKCLLLTGLLSFTTQAVNAQEGYVWEDVTDQYVVNPRFDGNADYWSWNIPCWNSGYQGASYTNGEEGVTISGFIESWVPTDIGNLGEGQIWQDLGNLPKGEYRLEADIIASKQIDGEISMGAELFMKDGDNEFYIPCSTLSGQPLHYVLDGESVSGYLQIGLRTAEPLNVNWVAMDNVVLKRLVPPTHITSLSLERTSVTLLRGESWQLGYSFLPQNVNDYSFQWTSSTSSVVSVSAKGMLTARGEGKATVTLTETKSGLSASCEVTVTSVEGEQSSLIINEVQVANIDMFLDPANCYGGWVELYNPTDLSIKLTNMFISDDATNLKKFRYTPLTQAPVIHAHGHYNIWFDHNSADGSFGYNGKGADYQVNFKLNRDGGTIYISDNDGKLLASQTYPAAVPRCSYARISDGAATWGMTGNPTPATSNNGGFATQRLDAPVVSVSGGVFNPGTTVSFSVNRPSGAVLVWTEDGSTPTMTNGNRISSGTASFKVSNTSVYRFALFQDGYLPSPVVTRSFIFKNHDYYLPIISIVTNPDNMFSAEHGVLTKGTAGVPGNGRNDANYNWNMSWERPVNFEYMVPNQNQDGSFVSVINQESDFEICGGWSRSMYGGAACTVDGHKWELQSSFRLKSDAVYEGVDRIDYPVFPGKPHNRYKVWQVRNGGNDQSRIKDAALGQMVLRSGFYVDVQDCQPAHVFINGMYYGMLNIRESNNRHYGYSNYGIDTDDMDQFDLGQAQYNQKVGDDVAWKQLIAAARTLSTSPSQANFDAVNSLLDIDEFVNYMALECFIGSNDWVTNVNNVKGFRSRTDGKFHFVFFDCDQGFADSNMLYNLLHNSYTAEVDDLFRYLMKYEPIKAQFTSAYQIVNASVLNPDKIVPIVNEMYERTNRALGFEWKSSSIWVANEVQNAYNGVRMNKLINEGFVSASRYNLNLTANIPSAHLHLNGQEIPYQSYNGITFAPIVLTAKAPAGYTFLGWKTGNGGEEISTDILPWASNWRYNQTSDLTNVAWTSTTYNDNSWTTGQTPMGFANAGKYMQTSANTVLTKGRRTYYFRNTFTLPETPANDDKYFVYYRVDDGIRIHINGADIGGYHCNQGAGYNDFSTTYEGDTPYEGYFQIPNSLLKKGTNVIACDVHNTSDSSSDIYFDAKVVRIEPSESVYLSTDETFCLSDKTAGTYTLEAVFRKAGDQKEMTTLGATPVRINEVSAGNDIHINEYNKRNDWVELYNTTEQDVDIQGMILCGNANGQRYQISGNANVNTIIPANGTLVVWCDELEPLTQLHAPFKLDNSDGSSISIQASDGTWEDKLTYLEQPRWYTYGRYPDGGVHESLLSQPTINRSNRLGTYDFTSADPADWVDTDQTVILALSRGWNWVSHNMDSDVDRTRLTGYAQYIKSQHQDVYKDSKLGWIGTLNSLNPQQSYKVQMNSNADVTLRGQIYDSHRTVRLVSGWNWIGFPLYNSTNITAALQNYRATEGDQIIGLDQMATYTGGRWSGTLTSLVPGQGYMLKSAREQELRWNSLSQVMQKSKRYAAPVTQMDNPWELDIHQYPNVMGMIARVEIDGEEAMDGSYRIGAFWGDECRGVATMCDGLLYMNIHGEGGEPLQFRLMDIEGSEYVMDQKVLMSSLSTLGTAQTPYVLSLTTGDATGIESVALGSEVVSTEYYNLGGQRISRPETMCLRKTTYRDGRVITKKIIQNYEK